MVFSVGFVWFYQAYQPSYPNHDGVVIESKEVKKGYRYTVKYGLLNYHLYTEIDLEIGQIITVQGQFELYEVDQFKGDFSPSDYHKAKFVYYVIYQPKITLKDKVWFPHKIHHDLKTHIETLPEFTELFCKSLVLGVFETEYKEQISKIGITHLFVLSGLHVTILVGMIDKFLFFLPKKPKKIIESTFLLSYLMITLFPTSLIRAVIQSILYEWLNKEKESYTRLDVFSFTFIFMLLINPYYFQQLGFQLTFLVSFLFIIGQFKADIVGNITSTFYAQTLVLPITSKITQQVYPIAFFVTPLFIPLFNYILLPLSWLALLNPLGEILEPLFRLMMTFITFLEYQAISLQIPMITGVFAVIYFLLWTCAYACEDKYNQLKRAMWLLIFVMIMPYLKGFNPVGKVVFLSVGQGDTTIIERPNRSCTVVIDAFGDVVSYLKYNQISYIDYLIITHGDYDHHRETITILDHLKVGKLILSKHDQSDFKTEVSKYHPRYVEAGDKITCGDIELNVLSPNQVYQGNNDNSIVLQTTIQNTRYLFTGDVEYEAEKVLLTQYREGLKSDVLKVGHHGSKSSTNTSFLMAVSPTYAIISSGFDNQFGHPHDEVIQRLIQQRVKIYQTSQVHTICFIDLPFYRHNVILVHKKG